MKFEYLKIWLRWYWLPYKEYTVLDVSVRWLCFELGLKRQPTQRALDALPASAHECFFSPDKYGVLRCVVCSARK